MQQEFWPDWADFLMRWKLNPLVCEHADRTGSFMTFISRFPVLVAPIFGVRQSRLAFSTMLGLSEGEAGFTRFSTQLQETGK